MITYDSIIEGPGPNTLWMRPGKNQIATRSVPMSVADLRKEYMLHGLHEADLDSDPIAQFQAWFGQALAAGLPEPNAMTLATATAGGRPSARMVLIKGADARGFVFFT